MFLETWKGRFRRHDFAYEYSAQLASVMTSRQIVSCKLDTRHSHDMHLDVVSENQCARVDGRKSWSMLVAHDSRKQKSYRLNRP